MGDSPRTERRHGRHGRTTVSTKEFSDDETAATDVDEPRYAEIHLGGASYVVYDRQNHQAWVQSETTVSLADSR